MQNIVGKLFFHLLDGGNAFGGKILGDLQNIILRNVLAFEIYAVFYDQNERFRLDGILLHKSKILFKFTRGDHLFGHHRLHGLVEIGIFFRADTFRLALGIVRGEIAHGKGRARYDLQKIEIFPKPEGIDDLFFAHVQRAGGFREGICFLHVLAQVQPENIYLDRVAVGKRHIFIDKLIFNICVRRERELTRIRAKSHNENSGERLIYFVFYAILLYKLFCVKAR